MKKLYLLTILLASVFITPVPAMAGTRVGVNIVLPPIVIGGPIDLVEIPDTDEVYVAPDVNVELFFWGGWWWRPYEGRWYRSHYYDRGWTHYNSVPRFSHHVDPGWRGNYRAHTWHGHQWNYHRVPSRSFQGHGQQEHNRH